MIEWIVLNPWAMWLIAALLLGALEEMTGDSWFLIGAVGAGAGSVASAMSSEGWVWWLAASLTALMSAPLLRPELVERLSRGCARLAMLAALPGSTVTVTSSIEGGVGQVKTEDEGVWSGRCLDASERLFPGDLARVLRVAGSVLVLEPLSRES